MDAPGAIADPVRREILGMLRSGTMNAGEIARHFDISRPAVSRHLRVLRESGLVHDRALGRQRVYALDARPLAELDTWLDDYRELWERKLDALGVEVQRTKEERR